MVYLNGLPRYVPRIAESYYAMRGALGVQRCTSVCREPPEAETGRPPLVPIPIVPLDFEKPWEFVEEEHYVTLGYWARGEEPEPSGADERAPWEKPPGWWK